MNPLQQALAMVPDILRSVEKKLAETECEQERAGLLDLKQHLESMVK